MSAPDMAARGLAARALAFDQDLAGPGGHGKSDTGPMWHNPSSVPWPTDWPRSA